MATIIYCYYWKTYSRLLAKEEGVSVEINLTPINGNWNEVTEEIIRIHFTNRSPKDKIMGEKFIPESVVKNIKGNIGGFLADKLITFDYLGYMYNKYNVSTVNDLRDALSHIPNNGGMKWADIF